ncbi:MAG: DinB family protein [Pirellula sp.]
MQSKIDQYVVGGSHLVQSIWGLTQEQLHSRPADGTWTIHQIVTHMLDSDLIGSDRMKRIACMDKPLLVGYDETAFSNLPGREQIDAFTACDLFHRNRQMTAVILRALPSTAWERIGIHTEAGAVSLAQMLDKYVGHLEHHLAFISKKRTMLVGSSGSAT